MVGDCWGTEWRRESYFALERYFEVSLNFEFCYFLIVFFQPKNVEKLLSSMIENEEKVSLSLSHFSLSHTPPTTSYFLPFRSIFSLAKFRFLKFFLFSWKRNWRSWSWNWSKWKKKWEIKRAKIEWEKLTLGSARERKRNWYSIENEM